MRDTDSEDILRDYDLGAESAMKLVLAAVDNGWNAAVWAGFLDRLLSLNPGKRPSDPTCLECVKTFEREHEGQPWIG